MGLGHLHGTRGTLAEGIDLLTRAAALCRERRIDVLAPHVSGLLGFLYVRSGDVDQGFSLMDRARSAMERMGIATQFHTRLLGHLSEASLAADRLADARDLARQTLGLARERSERGTELYALQLSAAVAAHRAALDRPVAEAYYGDALALANTLGRRPSAARCHLELGELYLRVDAREEARRHLEDAVAMFREMDMRSWLAQAEVKLREAA